MDIFLRVIPFFLVLGVGAVLASGKVLTEAGGRGLALCVQWALFPALLFRAAAAAPLSDPTLYASVGVYLLCGFAVMAGAYALSAQLGLKRAGASVSASCAGLGMSAFLTLPLSIVLYGDKAGGLGAVLVAADFTILTAIVAALLSGRNFAKAMIQVARNPLVIGSFLGLAAAALKVKITGPLDAGIEMLARSASPIGLLSLGAALAHAPKASPEEQRRTWTGAILSNAFKLAVFPLICFFALKAIGAPRLFVQVSTLLAAGPPAVSNFVQARVYNTAPEQAALGVGLGTVVSLASLTVVAALLA